MQNILSITALTSALFISGCVETGGSQEPQNGQEIIIDSSFFSKYTVFNFNSNGREYLVRYRLDNVFKLHGILLERVTGGEFSGEASEDAEAQNVMRDALRSANACGENEFPGLVQFGYGLYSVDTGQKVWQAKFKCTDTFQANI